MRPYVKNEKNIYIYILQTGEVDVRLYDKLPVKGLETITVSTFKNIRKLIIGYHNGSVTIGTIVQIEACKIDQKHVIYCNINVAKYSSWRFIIQLHPRKPFQEY